MEINNSSLIEAQDKIEHNNAKYINELKNINDINTSIDDQMNSLNSNIKDVSNNSYNGTLNITDISEKMKVPTSITICNDNNDAENNLIYFTDVNGVIYSYEDNNNNYNINLLSNPNASKSNAPINLLYLPYNKKYCAILSDNLYYECDTYLNTGWIDKGLSKTYNCFDKYMNTTFLSPITGGGIITIQENNISGPYLPGVYFNDLKLSSNEPDQSNLILYGITDNSLYIFNLIKEGEIFNLDLNNYDQYVLNNISGLDNLTLRKLTLDLHNISNYNSQLINNSEGIYILSTHENNNQEIITINSIKLKYNNSCPTSNISSANNNDNVYCDKNTLTFNINNIAPFEINLYNGNYVINENSDYNSYNLALNKYTNTFYILHKGITLKMPMNYNSNTSSKFSLTNMINNYNLNVINGTIEDLKSKLETSVENINKMNGTLIKNKNDILIPRINEASKKFNELKETYNEKQSINGLYNESNINEKSKHMIYIFWTLFTIITLSLVVLSFILPDIISIELIIAYFAIILIICYFNREYITIKFNNLFNT